MLAPDLNSTNLMSTGEREASDFRPGIRQYQFS